MTVAIGPSGGFRSGNGDIKGRFEDLSAASYIKHYLKNVLTQNECKCSTIRTVV